MSGRIAKAQGFTSFVSVLREQLAPSTFERLAAALPPQTRAVVDKPPMAMSWIPQEHFDALLTATWDLAVAKNEEAMVDLSRRQMVHDMSTIYKVLMHLASVDAVLKKSATIYSTYSQNGRMVSRSLEPKHAEIAMEDVESGTPAYFAYLRGAIIGVLEAAGTKSFKVVMKSGGGSSHGAIYDITWS